MSNDFYTEDLGDIMSSTRERLEVTEILNAWNKDGLPDTFDPSGAKFAFNRNSGNVFLVNDNYDVAMMNGDKLETFYTTPYDGVEGFISDLLEENTPDELHADDAEYIREAAEREGVELPEAWKTEDNESEEA